MVDKWAFTVKFFQRLYLENACSKHWGKVVGQLPWRPALLPIMWDPGGSKSQGRVSTACFTEEQAHLSAGREMTCPGQAPPCHGVGRAPDRPSLVTLHSVLTSSSEAGMWRPLWEAVRSTGLCDKAAAPALRGNTRRLRRVAANP